ncbi:16S rRNA (uracil(1498)-N(3))-methyltransferase [Helicobacter sp. 23-1046]
MRFLYHSNAGHKQLIIDGEQYAHIYKSRRAGKNAILNLCNLRDRRIYAYRNIHIDRHKATLELVDSKDYACIARKPAHIIWAIIEPKIIEKTLPTLNELGISKISFFYADFSQKNFTLNMERMQKILIQSCEQCGRNELVEMEILRDLNDALMRYPNALAFDVAGDEVSEGVMAEKLREVRSVIIGAEGGFSPSERAMLKTSIRLQSDIILRSQSATLFAASALNLL